MAGADADDLITWYRRPAIVSTKSSGSKHITQQGHARALVTREPQG